MKKKILCIFACMLLITTALPAIEAGNEIKDARTNELEYFQNIDFQPLIAPPEPIRQPAEFEPMEGALIRYPFGIFYEIIAEMAEDVEVVTIVADTSEQSYVESQYLSHGINLDHCSFLIAPSDSYWTRDYGPWFVFTGNDELGVVNFTYNRPQRPNDDAIPSAFAADQGFPLYFMPLMHTGGNYMTDGQGISISTDLVWNENSGYTHQEIDQIVNDYLGITTYHVVSDVLGAYIKHIDCWAKYLATDVIMIIEVSPSHSHYDEIEEGVKYFENQTSCYGTHYQIERVYTHLNEPYINSLILNDKVLVPITGSEWDDDALKSYEDAMPGYEVIGFTGSWLPTDALHCRVNGIPDRHMLYIEHSPLSGVQPSDDGFDIETKIVPYSGENLIPGSTGVYWKLKDDDWHFIQMESIGDDYYHAVIPPQEDGATVYYYIHAEDNSDRSEDHPYIGAPGAHSFSIPKSAFLMGLISNANESESFTTFNARILIWLNFNPFDFKFYSSGEQITISKDYIGYVGPRFIIGRFNAAVI